MREDDEPDFEQRQPRVIWAHTITPEPTRWAWVDDDGHGRIPSGSVSVAAGREGTGKSSFGIWMTANITRGTLPGSLHGTPLPTLYVAVEDSWKYTLVPRLLAAGADLEKVGRFDVINALTDDELELSLPRDNVLLEAAIEQHGIALVVIDPLISVIGATIDTHREREVRSALEPLVRLADHTDVVLLGIAHFNKGGGTDAASLITGSGAFKNVPRSVFGFAKDDNAEDDTRVMSQVKNSLGRDSLPSFKYAMESAEVPTPKGVAHTGRFVFQGRSDRSVAEVIRDSTKDPEVIAEKQDATTWIKGYLESEGGSALATDVINAGKLAGFPEDTLKKARSKVATTKHDGFGKGSTWTWVLIVDLIDDTDTEDDSIGGSIGAIGGGNQRVASKTPMPPPMEDSRPACDSCGSRLGRSDAEHGTCIRCRRIAGAEAEAEASCTPPPNNREAS